MVLNLEKPHVQNMEQKKNNKNITFLILKKINNYNNLKNFSIYNIILNLLMQHGNKYLTEKLLFKMFIELQKAIKKNLKIVIKYFLKNSIFFMELRKKKKKKKLLQEIPYLIYSKTRLSLVLKKILTVTNKNFKIFILLKNEILNSLKNNNKIIENRKLTYNNILKKKSFAHFRWFY